MAFLFEQFDELHKFFTSPCTACNQLQAFQQGMGQERGSRGSINVASRALNEHFDDFSLGSYESPKYTCRLAECPHVDNARRTDIEVCQDPPPLLAQHPEPMRIVEQQPGVVSFTQLQQAWKRYDISIHAEYGVRYHEFPSGLRCCKLPLQNSQIQMGITTQPCAR